MAFEACIDSYYRMGECSFGKGFGQTNPYAEAPEGAAEAFWRSIPRSIFDTLAKRYQVLRRRSSAA